MRFVFDLDECLIATRAAHRAAYREAGFEVPPEFDYEPRSRWSRKPGPEIVAAKARHFPAWLRAYGRELPCAVLAKHLLRFSTVEVLTGTSGPSVDAIRIRFPWTQNLTIETGMTHDDKIAWMRARCEQREDDSGVYFDDWPLMVQRVRKETPWQAIDVSGF